MSWVAVVTLFAPTCASALRWLARVRPGSRRLLKHWERGLREIALFLSRFAGGPDFRFWHGQTIARIATLKNLHLKLTHYRLFLGLGSALRPGVFPPARRGLETNERGDDLREEVESADSVAGVTRTLTQASEGSLPALRRSHAAWARSRMR